MPCAVSTVASFSSWPGATSSASGKIVEDRYERRSTIVTSQVPVDRWYEIIGNPTIADAILDRLVHNAYRIELSGESLRKRSPRPTVTAAS
ncbi:DNA replication protein DnaC [Amorphus sp. MBR-141]